MTKKSKGSGKYRIPGVGIVGVYEYRMYLRKLLRKKREELYKEDQYSRLSSRLDELERKIRKIEWRLGI